MREADRETFEKALEELLHAQPWSPIGQVGPSFEQRVSQLQRRFGATDQELSQTATRLQQKLDATMRTIADQPGYIDAAAILRRAAASGEQFFENEVFSNIKKKHNLTNDDLSTLISQTSQNADRRMLDSQLQRAAEQVGSRNKGSGCLSVFAVLIFLGVGAMIL